MASWHSLLPHPPPSPPHPYQKACGAMGLVCTSWSLGERPGGPGAQARGLAVGWRAQHSLWDGSQAERCGGDTSGSLQT